MRKYVCAASAAALALTLFVPCAALADEAVTDAETVDSSVLTTGSVKVNGSYYIYDSTGSLSTSKKKVRVVEVDGVEYGAAKTGKALKGIYVYKNKFYKFGKTGRVDTVTTKKLRKAAKYGKSFKALQKLIGKPLKSKWVAGCYNDGGKDGTLTYKNFKVSVHKTGKKTVFWAAY